MVFYIGRVTKYFTLEPKFLCKTYREHVERLVKEKVEGQSMGKLGFAVAVLPNISEEDIKLGLVDNDTGGVKVTVRVQVLFLKFFKNEVVDAVVNRVHEYGLDLKIGPVSGFIYNSQLSEGGDGIPNTWRYNSENGDCWEMVGDETEGVREIREGQLIRCKVRLVDAKIGGQFNVILTIDDFYLV